MIIFLDFDGVLHPTNATSDNFFCCRDHFESILFLYPDIDIVISSSWRELMPLHILKEFFSESIRNRIIGVTPMLDNEITSHRHFEEIRLWIKQNRYEGDWLAIDDALEEFPEECLPLIVCNERRGFDAAVAAQLVKAVMKEGREV